MERNWADVEKQLEEVNSGSVETETRDPMSGRTAAVVKPEGTLTYGYDAHGALAMAAYHGQRVFYGYDQWGRLNSVKNGADEWAYTYWTDNGQVRSIANRHAGLAESRTYDALGRLLTLGHTNLTNNSTLYGTVFTLGPDGTRLSATETKANANGTQTQSKWVYQYDALGRLVQEQFNHDTANGNNTFDDAGDRDITYEYDKDSNRTWLHDLNQHASSRAYAYNNKQQLIEIKAPGSADHEDRDNYDEVIQTQEWTGKGELQTAHHWENGEDAWQENYTWGVNSTLLQVTITGAASEQNGTIVQYAYDDNGTLVRRKVTKGGATISDEKYLVDYNNPTGYSQTVATLTGTGNGNYAITQTNTFGDRIFSQTNFSGNASNTNYLIGDALGSIRALTGKTGDPSNQVQQYGYTTFGEPMEGETGNRGLTRYAFTGQVLDSETGLQYHRARWLKEQFMSRDSVFDFPGNSGSCYGYAGSNPVNYTDVSGLSLLDTMATAAIQGTLAGIALGSPLIFTAIGIQRLGVQISTNNFDFVPSALILGVDASMGWRIPKSILSVGISGGAERLFFRPSIFNPNVATYAYAGFNTSVSPGFSFAAKIGFVWNLKSKGDYKGPYFSVTAPSMQVLWGLFAINMISGLNKMILENNENGIYNFILCFAIVNQIIPALAQLGEIGRRSSITFFYTPFYSQGDPRNSFGLSVNFHAFGEPAYGQSLVHYSELQDFATDQWQLDLYDNYLSGLTERASQASTEFDRFINYHLGSGDIQQRAENLWNLVIDAVKGPPDT